MLVLLNAGPIGGQSVDWADDAPDGDIKVILVGEDKLRYRLDYSEGSATFIGEEPKPVPTRFVPRAAPAQAQGGEALPEPTKPEGEVL